MWNGIHRPMPLLVQQWEVHWTLGPGYLEAVYQVALAIELAEKGIPFKKKFRLE